MYIKSVKYISSIDTRIAALLAAKIGHFQCIPIRRGLLSCLLIPVFMFGIKAQETGFSTGGHWLGSASGLQETPILSMARHPNGDWYLGSEQGLWRWDGRQGTLLSGKQNIPFGIFHHLRFSRDTLLTGWLDSLYFSYDGVHMTWPESVQAFPGYPKKDSLPEAMDPSGVILKSTPNGLYLEYQIGWEKLTTPRCDMPWSVIDEPGQGTFLLACYRENIQRYDKKGQFIRSFPIPPGDLPPAYRQLFPGYVCVDGFGCMVGGFYTAYRFQNEKLDYTANLGGTQEAFAYDTLTGTVWTAGTNIHVLHRDGRVEKDQIRIAPEVVVIYSATDMLVEREEVWVSGIGGVGRYDRNTKKWEVFNLDNGGLPSVRTFHLFQSPGGRLYAGLEDGLAVFDTTERRFHRLFPDMIREQVGQMMSLGEDTLILIEARHVYFFHEKKSGLELISVHGERQGLRLLEFNENGAMIDDAGYLYLTDFEGVHRFDLRRLEAFETSDENLVIERLGQHPLPFNGDIGYQLIHRGKKMEVGYRKVGPFAELAIAECRLNGGPWRSLEMGPRCVLDSLDHGPLALDIRLRIPGVPEEKWPLRQFSMYINWPLLDYPIIRFLLITGFISLCFALVAYGVTGYREKKQLEQVRRMLLDSRNKAIESQLDPGFVMKGISVILDDIQARERKRASQHLVHLARTLRKMLDITFSGADQQEGVSQIPLDREISFLEDIIQLEKNKRPGDFVFVISVDDDIWEENPLIPPLILPPVVNWLLASPPGPSAAVARLSLSISGNPERIFFQWEAIPAEGEYFYPGTGSFLDSREGQNFEERAELLRQLGIDVVLREETGEERYRFFMAFGHSQLDG